MIRLARKQASLFFAVAAMAICESMVTVAVAEETPTDGASSGTQPAADTAPATADRAPAIPSEAGEPQPSAQPAPQDDAATGETSAPAPAAPPPQTLQATTDAAAPPLQPLTETALPPVPSGQKRYGFALELFFGINKPLIELDEEFLEFNSLNGGLFLGGKVNRVIVGMGFEMSRMRYHRKYQSVNSADYYYDSDSDDEYTWSLTRFIFKPGVRFVMVQSEDQKVDMFGQIDVGAGTLLEKDESDIDEGDDKYFLLEWDAALGARYWPHRQFAVSATGGVQGDFLREKYGDTGSIRATHVMGIVGALQLLGVF